MTVYEPTACPVCTTHDFRVLTDANAVRNEMEKVWEFHTRRIKLGAPVQQFFDRAIFSQDPPLEIVQCMHCETVMRAPREDAGALVDLYAGEQPSDHALQSLLAAQIDFFKPRVETITKLNGSTGSVLEVGSYIGGFLLAASRAGWRARGIDVNPHTNAFARSMHAHVSAQTLDEIDTAEKFDVVAIWNCFDQLPDPRAALVRAHELLKPNGIIVLRIPNGACYAALYDKPALSTVLAYNNLLMFPYRNGFTISSIGKLLEETQLMPALTKGDTLVSIAGDYTKAWAVREERVVKTLIRALFPKKLQPWLEVYARRRQDHAQ